MTDDRKWRPALERLTEDVDALVLGVTTSERVDRFSQKAGEWQKTNQRHVVHHPPLLDQLGAAIQASTMTLDDAFRPSFGSKPSARLDAIAALERIGKQAKEWALELNSRDHAPLKDVLRGLVGGATNFPSYQADLARATRSWVVMAKVVTGMEAPPFTPDVPCSNTECEKRGGLRVRLDEKVAYCTECDAYWDSDHIGQFAEYVAWASEHLKGPRHWILVAGEGVVPEFRECVECLAIRQQMADRVAERRHAQDVA